jgi:aldehyde:ferredoxin oxidoreductase
MGVPEEAIERILSSETPQKEDLQVGRLLKYSHRWFSILGSLGICARAQINRFYNAALCAELYESVTGIKTDLEDLRLRADRVWTLLRMANLREGFTSEAKDLPQKWFEEPGFHNYISDKPLSREEAAHMAEDYYDEQGWDRQTGIPTKSRLEELGLSE